MQSANACAGALRVSCRIASLGNARERGVNLVARASARERIANARESPPAGRHPMLLMNALVFALWYWQLDRGGPLERRMQSLPQTEFLGPTRPKGLGRAVRPIRRPATSAPAVSRAPGIRRVSSGWLGRGALLLRRPLPPPH